jgi:hypothetical protein
MSNNRFLQVTAVVIDIFGLRLIGRPSSVETAGVFMLFINSAVAV